MEKNQKFIQMRKKKNTKIEISSNEQNLNSFMNLYLAIYYMIMKMKLQKRMINI